MPQGQEHIVSALTLIESAAGTLVTASVAKEPWRSEAITRLASITTLLQATMDRFFLKTKLCLPFARRCEDEANKLVALLAEQCATPASDGEAQLKAALDDLEKAAKTLDERSLMQGMAIT